MSNEISTERAVCVPGNVTKGFEAAVAGISALQEQDYRIHEKSLPGQMGWAYVKSLVFHFLFASATRKTGISIQSPPKNAVLDLEVMPHFGAFFFLTWD